MNIVYGVDAIRILYCDSCTTIQNSYMLKTKAEIRDIVLTILSVRKEKGLIITRNEKSYMREIKAHNRLYKLRLFRSHTKDCDCEEFIKKSKEILYFIIGF